MFIGKCPLRIARWPERRKPKTAISQRIPTLFIPRGYQEATERLPRGHTEGKAPRQKALLIIPRLLFFAARGEERGASSALEGRPYFLERHLSRKQIPQINPQHPRQKE